MSRSERIIAELGYNPAERLVDLAADIIAADPEQTERLQIAADNLAEVLNVYWPIGVKDPPFWGRSAFAGELDDRPHDIQMLLLTFMADIIITSVDGPQTTAASLRRLFDSIQERMR